MPNLHCSPVKFAISFKEFFGAIFSGQTNDYIQHASNFIYAFTKDFSIGMT